MKKLDSHAKSSTVSKVYRCCCNFFVKILDDFHDFVSECVSFQRKINNPFWGVSVFPTKSDNFHWTCNKNTHFTDENQRKTSLRSADLTIIFLLEYYNHSTTTSSHWVHRSTFLLRVNLTGACMWANVDVAHAQGAAWRRRQRRLRAHWRHEQLTLQMLLATYEHHAAPRGTEQGGGERVEQRHGPEDCSSQHGQHGVLDDDGDVLAARPTPFVEVRPQPGAQRHTVEQIIETFVPVQVLDAPVPQMGTQLVEFMQKLDSATPEQVIEVPKLSQDRIPQRLVESRPPQMAEQLVEVPTVLSFSSLQQQSAEQIIDIPAPRRRRGHGGLQGLRPEQSSTASFSSAERISERTVVLHVDIPVPGREGRASGLQGFLPGQGSATLQKRISELILEQFGDFSGGGLQDFRPGQSSPSSSHAHSRSELPPHSSPWTPAAHDASMVLEEADEDDEPAIEYVECDGLWWRCEWVPARQQYCWWLAAADGFQVGHTIWRPPWLVGSR